jgi:hypothetical protein
LIALDPTSSGPGSASASFVISIDFRQPPHESQTSTRICVQASKLKLAAWISAFIAHYLAKDGAKAFAPLVFLLILAISYLTRPASRQCHAIATPISSSEKG